MRELLYNACNDIDHLQNAIECENRFTREMVDVYYSVSKVLLTLEGEEWYGVYRLWYNIFKASSDEVSAESKLHHIVELQDLLWDLYDRRC